MIELTITAWAALFLENSDVPIFPLISVTALIWVITAVVFYGVTNDNTEPPPIALAWATLAVLASPLGGAALILSYGLVVGMKGVVVGTTRALYRTYKPEKTEGQLGEPRPWSKQR